MNASPQSQEKLLFAFPSKGRLREQALKIFEKGRISILGTSDRGYTANMPSFPEVSVVLLPAREIARALADKNVHIGITGRDLLREDFPQTRFLEKPLSFGEARLVVSVPQSWIDVASLDDLIDAAALFRQKQARRMRVATKYPNLVRNFFSKRGFLDYQLVESMGATEAAIARHSAEIIVDLSSTGLTLKHNRLKTLSGGTVLESSAILASASQKAWNQKLQNTAQKLQNAILNANKNAANAPKLQNNFLDELKPHNKK